MNRASLLLWLLLLPLLLAPGTVGAADERAEAAAGQDLARHWCATCHAVGRDQLSSRDPEAPSFVEVAHLRNTTPLSLRTFLQTPHAGMLGVRLTPHQTDEIIDYILSLRP